MLRSLRQVQLCIVAEQCKRSHVALNFRVRIRYRLGEDVKKRDGNVPLRKDDQRRMLVSLVDGRVGTSQCEKSAVKSRFKQFALANLAVSSVLGVASMAL